MLREYTLVCTLSLTSPVDCLCDFTYDFYWQHKGERLLPSNIIPHQKDTSYTYEDLVLSLKRGKAHGATSIKTRIETMWVNEFLFGV